MSEPNWITPAMALAIHERQLAEHGGKSGLREESLILSALARPQQRWHYGDPPPDLCELAAAYAYGLVKNHPFLNSNKPTAFVVYRVFLKWNGLELQASKADRYTRMLALAAGDHSEKSFAAWLREVTSPAA